MTNRNQVLWWGGTIALGILASAPFWMRPTLRLEIDPKPTPQVQQSISQAVPNADRSSQEYSAQSTPTQDIRAPRFAPTQHNEAVPIYPKSDTFDATATGTLHLHVVTDRGQPVTNAWINYQCDQSGGGGNTDENGWMTLTDLAPGACTFSAKRKDGQLETRASKTMNIDGDEEHHLILKLPHRKTGGIGIQFVPTRLGKRIVRVVPNSPADEAGLEAGDIVTHLDGESILSMDDAGFVAAMTGPVGTRVLFTVGYMDADGWNSEQHEVTRLLIE